MTDREATEHRNDWHGGKRVAFGKRRQRGLREGRAATGGKGLGTLRGMMAGTVGSGQQLESASSGGCGRAELLWMANGEKENAETIGDD